MTYFILKKNNLTYYINEKLKSLVEEEMERLEAIFGTSGNSMGETYLYMRSDFVVNKDNEFVKCRYHVHDLIEAFIEKQSKLKECL